MKYEAGYFHDLRDGIEAERVIGAWIEFYNEVPPHSSLRGRTRGAVSREDREAA